jgi:O-antigen ligase
MSDGASARLGSALSIVPVSAFIKSVREDALAAAAWLVVVTATIFGGASQTNALSLMVVELSALPLLFLAASPLVLRGVERSLWPALLILTGVIAVPIFQLIPLPESIWGHLPGRGPELTAVNLAHVGQPALPISLTPEYTWRSLLALVPPAAMFLAAIQLSDRERRIAVALWLTLGVVSVVIGIFQVLGGQNSPLYFYSVTNSGLPVGLFSNRNHQAAFLYSLLVMSSVFVSNPRARSTDTDRMASALAVLFAAVCLVGVAITLSRTGIILALVGIIGWIALVVRPSRFRERWRLGVLLGLPVVIGLAATVLFRLSPIINRFSQLGDKELRFEGWPVVLKLAQDFAPIGSGIGSFDVVYRSVEPLSQVSNAYFNHAHDDYLELWLETGWIGVGLLIAFIIWLVWRLWNVFMRRARGVEVGKASGLVLVLLMAHSLVDYPLRTEAIAVLFAFCCGVVARQENQLLVPA